MYFIDNNVIIKSTISIDWLKNLLNVCFMLLENNLKSNC